MRLLKGVLSVTVSKTVNRNELTVSKLSQLQKKIVDKVKAKGAYALCSLAYDIADEHHIRKTEKTEKVDAYWREVLKKNPLPWVSNCAENRTYGEKDIILDGKFKAIFYRSVARLVKRGILQKGYAYWDNEITQEKCFFKTVSLSEGF